MSQKRATAVQGKAVGFRLLVVRAGPHDRLSAVSSWATRIDLSTCRPSDALPTNSASKFCFSKTENVEWPLTSTERQRWYLVPCGFNFVKFKLELEEGVSSETVS